MICSKILLHKNRAKTNRSMAVSTNNAFEMMMYVVALVITMSEVT